MSYVVLARKYRPRTFADMVGQETSTGVLRGAIQEGRIGHAYLFCGPRGTGKTTTARIFAKCLNCEIGPTAEPCGTCERCVAMDAGADADVLEIDAASNTGVDDVRGLRDMAAYMPLRARFKVYIIDEVHMLSRPAVNAFLKTLEEPPPHVKFLFATTDPEKLPETILSRCQVLRLAPIAEKVIATRLEQVFGNEGVSAEDGVALELARRARGGMRDALSLADQLLSLVGNAPRVVDLERLAAAGGSDLVGRLLDLVEARDRAGVLGALPASEGGEGELAAGLLDQVRAALVLLVCGAGTAAVQAEGDARERLHARATRLGAERLELMLQELLHARERMRLLPAHARVVLEVALLDLCREETTLALARIAERLEALEMRLAAGNTASAPLAVPRAESVPRTAVDHGTIVPVAARESTGPAARSGSASPMASAAATVAAPALGASVVSSAGAAASASTNLATGLAPPSRVASAVARPTVTHTQVAPAASDCARPMLAGTQDTWLRVLDGVGATMSALAETLRARGRLIELAEGRAVIKFQNLREGERAVVLDARNQKCVSAAFESLLGAGVRVTFDDGAAAARTKDAFTGRVAELFEGRIEDEG